jgi:sugar phosphate isomerase/epimerase
MPAPIALQLYSLRELLAADYAAGVRKAAEIGYAGVETAGFPGTTPQAAAQLFQELGLTVCSAHSPLPLGDKQAEVLDTMAALGCSRLPLEATGTLCVPRRHPPGLRRTERGQRRGPGSWTDTELSQPLG